MNLEQILISALDAEIEEYEKVLNFLPEPEFSLKHSRIIAKAVRIANKDVKESKKSMKKEGQGGGVSSAAVFLSRSHQIPTSFLSIQSILPTPSIEKTFQNHSPDS